MEAYAGVKNDRYRLWIVSHVMGQSAVRLNPPLLSHDACMGQGGPNDVSAGWPYCRMLAYIVNP